jgi:predicted glycosyltransferase
MKIALFPSHPSQLWMLKPVADYLSQDDHICWFMRDKDVMLELADAMGIEYTRLSIASTGLVGNGIEMAANFLRCIRHTLKDNIDVWVTKYGAGNSAARLCLRKTLSFNDDDADIVPLIAATSYTVAHAVLVPNVTRMGRYERKARRYNSSHELFYLHPNRFRPDSSIYQLLGIPSSQRFAIIRLSALKAHHDIGIRGISARIVRDLIGICGDDIKVFISSEAAVDQEFEAYRLPIPAMRIHDAMYYAEFLVADSQTMSAEAATMGTASFRISDFVGRLSYIDELERYGLSFGFRPDDYELAIKEIAAAVHEPEFKKRCSKKLVEFLDNKIDPVPWFAEQIRSIAQ